MQKVSNAAIIDGRKIAGEIIEDLKRLPKPNKKLAAVLVGSNRASESFLKQKEKTAKELGVEFQLYRFDEEISEDDLKNSIRDIQNDRTVGGLIIQLPLPKKFNRESVLSVLQPEKDIDALSLEAKVLPLPVMVVKDILAKINYYLGDKIVAVVGRGLLVGQPIAKWLVGKCQEVMVLHSQSDLNELKKADLVISGVGRPGLIKPEMLKPGAGVIDFGFSMVDGKIQGDLDVSSFKLQDLNFYTPTPGGTGPILVAELFKNFYILSKSLK